jgi:hypothetical protein
MLALPLHLLLQLCSLNEVQRTPAGPQGSQLSMLPCKGSKCHFTIWLLYTQCQGTSLFSPGSGLQDVRQPFQGHETLIVFEVKLLDVMFSLS